jgi:hypothetical protein
MPTTAIHDQVDRNIDVFAVSESLAMAASEGVNGFVNKGRVGSANVRENSNSGIKSGHLSHDEQSPRSNALNTGSPPWIQSRPRSRNGAESKAVVHVVISVVVWIMFPPKLAAVAKCRTGVTVSVMIKRGR